MVVQKIEHFRKISNASIPFALHISYWPEFDFKKCYHCHLRASLICSTI